jgi:general secretion pathway protein G
VRQKQTCSGSRVGCENDAARERSARERYVGAGDTPATTGAAAFTIVELLIVMAIIIVLAGLIIGTSGYVQKKGARSRAEAEIAAMSAALESYKADNGIYPRDSSTDGLNARTATSAADYASASLFLYRSLSGREANGTPITGAKSYFSFKPQMISGPRDASGNVSTATGVRDPFGNHYGYSTANQANAASGYNPTFDLWSTANSSNPAEWIRNW